MDSAIQGAFRAVEKVQDLMSYHDPFSELSRINQLIAMLEETNLSIDQLEIAQLKRTRKQNSIRIQDEIFNNYQFLNRDGNQKNMRDIFLDWNGTKPPSGAGECAGPRLLHYAYQHKLLPLALAEFWWGLSPKSDTWQHERYYLPCREKCEPILHFMLEGVED